jgi:hypothetical protein
VSAACASTSSTARHARVRARACVVAALAAQQDVVCGARACGSGGVGVSSARATCQREQSRGLRWRDWRKWRRAGAHATPAGCWPAAWPPRWAPGPAGTHAAPRMQRASEDAGADTCAALAIWPRQALCCASSAPRRTFRMSRYSFCSRSTAGLVAMAAAEARADQKPWRRRRSLRCRAQRRRRGAARARHRRGAVRGLRRLRSAARCGATQAPRQQEGEREREAPPAQAGLASAVRAAFPQSRSLRCPSRLRGRGRGAGC